MAEHMVAEEEERAWAMAQARAFLAPPGASSVAGRPSPDDEAPRPAVVVAVVVVPLPVPADEAWGERREARGTDEHEGERDG